MTVYIVFEETTHTPDREEGNYDLETVYRVIGQADEGDAHGAIRAVAAEAVTENDEGRKFWATPLRSWRGLGVKTKVVVDATPLTYGPDPASVDVDAEEAKAASPPGTFDPASQTMKPDEADELAKAQGEEPVTL